MIVPEMHVFEYKRAKYYFQQLRVTNRCECKAATGDYILIIFRRTFLKQQSLTLF